MSKWNNHALLGTPWPVNALSPITWSQRWVPCQPSCLSQKWELCLRALEDARQCSLPVVSHFTSPKLLSRNPELDRKGFQSLFQGVHGKRCSWPDLKILWYVLLLVIKMILSSLRKALSTEYPMRASYPTDVFCRANRPQVGTRPSFLDGGTPTPQLCLHFCQAQHHLAGGEPKPSTPGAGQPPKQSAIPSCNVLLPVVWMVLLGLQWSRLYATCDQRLQLGSLHQTLEPSLLGVLQTLGVYLRWGICSWHFDISPDLGVLRDIPAPRPGSA